MEICQVGSPLQAPLFLILLLNCLSDATQSGGMIPGDTRVVTGPLDSEFKIQTMLPGVYTKVVSGIHEVEITAGNCSTPLFTCTITEDMPYRTVATVTGILTYGLTRLTFFANNSRAPITVLFYPEHYWPVIDGSKSPCIMLLFLFVLVVAMAAGPLNVKTASPEVFNKDDLFAFLGSIQSQFTLPLVINAKGKQVVTFSSVILHTSLFSEPAAENFDHQSVILHPNFAILVFSQFSVYFSADHLLVYENEGADNVKNFSQILNFQVKDMPFHKIIEITVKERWLVDYYTISYDNYHDTYTIDWIKPNLIEDYLSILPLGEITSALIDSASQNSLFGSLVLIDCPRRITVAIHLLAKPHRTRDSREPRNPSRMQL
ncbi:unnamed protein product [Mesocestoides corti]|uniref:IgGFc-binding protein N-terminal domain-containing protein n=1 Tax=Mesocestoides corti TaxID=53468 RepID=A0A0R3U3G5_MESCO|nr:unnamed protein product [Mesocestoides corti]